MADVLKKYKKQKKISNIWILALSLVMAIGVNIFLIDGTSFGQNMKTSVIEATQVQSQADLYMSGEKWMYSIVNGKKISDIKSLSFTLSYNPAVPPQEITSRYGELQTLSNSEGMITVLVVFPDETHLDKWSEIIDIEAIKNVKTVWNFSILNANFKDSSNENYTLSTSGIRF